MLSKNIKDFVSSNTSINIAVILKDTNVVMGNGLRPTLLDHELNLWHLQQEGGVGYIIDGDEIVSIVPVG